MENGFHCHNSGQGRLTVKKGTIDKLLFLLKTIGIYPKQVSMILYTTNTTNVGMHRLIFYSLPGGTGLQIREGKGYFSIDFLEFSIEN